MQLWQDLAQYMSTEVPYTIKRLMPADLKVTKRQTFPQRSQILLKWFFFSIPAEFVRWLRRGGGGRFTISIWSKPICRWLCLCAMHEKRRHFYHREHSVCMVRSSNIRYSLTWINQHESYVCYCSVAETEWSIQLADVIVTTEWICEHCEGVFNINGIQRLQHKKGKYRLSRFTYSKVFQYRLILNSFHSLFATRENTAPRTRAQQSEPWQRYKKIRLSNL